MNSQSVADSSEVRIRITRSDGHEMIIGPFVSIQGTARLAYDLASDNLIASVAVEGRHALLGWRTIWSRSMEVAR